MHGHERERNGRERIPALAARVLGHDLSADWMGIDAVRPLIERIAQEGAVFLIKWDGERTGPEDTGRYTAAVSGGAMAGEAFRTDSDSVEEAVSRAILAYAAHAWPE